MNNANALVQRQQLQNHRRWAQKFGINAADIRPQTLVLYAKLAANKDVYEFDVSDKANSVIAIERRLKDSSLFFANLFGLAVLKSPVLSAATPPGEYPAGGRLLHYADKSTFAAAGSTSVLSEAACVDMLYHSKLTLNTDQGIRLDAMSCEVFQLASDTQGVSAANAVPSGGLNLVDLSTSFFIWGDRKNKFQLELPAGGERTNLAGTATGVNYVALILSGFEVVNVGNAARAKDFARYAEEQNAR